MKNIIRIITLLICFALLLSNMLLFVGCGTNQEDFEKAFTKAIEDEISSFKRVHTTSEYTLTYTVNFYKKEPVYINFYFETSETLFLLGDHNCSGLFPFINCDNKIIDSYGEVFINGKSRYVKKLKSSSKCSVCGDTDIFVNGFCEDCFNSFAKWADEHYE